MILWYLINFMLLSYKWAPNPNLIYMTVLILLPNFMLTIQHIYIWSYNSIPYCLGTLKNWLISQKNSLNNTVSSVNWCNESNNVLVCTFLIIVCSLNVTRYKAKKYTCKILKLYDCSSCLRFVVCPLVVVEFIVTARMICQRGVFHTMSPSNFWPNLLSVVCAWYVWAVSGFVIQNKTESLILTGFYPTFSIFFLQKFNNSASLLGYMNDK